jgi:hypothetical protein
MNHPRLPLRRNRGDAAGRQSAGGSCSPARIGGGRLSITDGRRCVGANCALRRPISAGICRRRCAPGTAATATAAGHKCAQQQTPSGGRSRFVDHGALRSRRHKSARVRLRASPANASASRGGMVVAERLGRQEKDYAPASTTVTFVIWSPCWIASTTSCP